MSFRHRTSHIRFLSVAATMNEGPSTAPEKILRPVQRACRRKAAVEGPGPSELGLCRSEAQDDIA